MAHVAHARVPLPTALPTLLGVELRSDALRQARLREHLLAELRAQRVRAPEDLVGSFGAKERGISGKSIEILRNLDEISMKSIEICYKSSQDEHDAASKRSCFT